MKRLFTFALLASALAVNGCGNDTLLSGISGGALGGDSNNSEGGDHEEEPDVTPCTGDEATMAEAAAALAGNICAECNAADGVAEALFAHINPQEYHGGPLEVGLVIGNPAGIAGSSTMFKINGTEFAIPAEAWKLSESGTTGRVVMLALEEGLPPGEYHVGLAIFAATAAEEEPHGADASATWSVQCSEEEPGDDPPGEEPGDTPGGDPDHPDEPADPPVE